MKLFFLLVALSCLVHSVAGYGSGISSTVFSIANYQAENGGFTSSIMEGFPGSLDDTTHSLFLTSLFGVNDKIDSEAAGRFIATLQNSDGGYGNQPGQASTLESTWNALYSYRILGTIHPDTSNLVSFVNSLYDTNAKLYRNSATSSPDFRSTARALQIFQILELEDKDVTAKKAEISAKLGESVKDNDDGHSFFSSITSDNYFGILAASLSGFEFEDVEDWIAYFKDRQVATGTKNGGFYADEYATEVDVSDAEYAVHAVFILNKNVVVSRTQLNLAALNGYLNSLPPAIASASHAYAALARSASFQDVFKIVPSYVVRDNRFKVVGNRIIQGTLFRPTLLFRTSYGQAHGGATATVTINHSDKTEVQTLTYNAQTQSYEGQEYFDTTGLYGDVVLSFTLNWAVPGFDALSFTSSDKKTIGYDINIKAKAVSADDQFDAQETIDIPTTFTFDVELGTVSVPKPQLVTGDFDVVLTVLDSSNVAIHTETINARKNKEVITFNYEQDAASLPSGRVTFRFQVKSDKGVHTTEEIWYNTKLTMVATDIDFDQDQVFNFNQQVKITMQPATYFNDAVETYEKLGSRRVFLDVVSPKGSVLASYPGQFQNNKYVFEYTLSPRLDFAGVHVLSFRYQDAFGNDFALLNFNSEDNELFTEKLTYTVDVAIEISDLVDAPVAGTLNYGQPIAFSFVAKDSYTDSAVQRGGVNSAIFLALRHIVDGKAITSSKITPVPERDAATGSIKYVVQWGVDPNVPKGNGQLVLFGTDADGNEIPLKYEGAVWSVDVTVDGSLQIENSAYSHVFDDQDTAFLVSFEFISQANKLGGADLTARIVHKGKVIGVVPVASSPEGSYQVSWTLPTNTATSGAYVVDIYRHIDLERAASPEKATPFFSVTLNHEGRGVSPLPFKTEFLVLLVLGLTLVSVSVQKTALEKKN
eukprot:TRINITY_DN10177_c0_g1_i1.p1 TRINITY_DN10177_c0_g1~~TRINITY_DN10177_c0_g1_i1.p1  ORF type:complete len:932 (-),score=283.99 TRINITY_DN10177_c0_g1_i1:114-2909(-)